MGFLPGRLLLHRGFHRDRLSWITVNRVVADDSRGVLMWRAPGGVHVRLVAQDGRSLRDMPFTEWAGLPTRLEHTRWRWMSVLTLIPPHASHSVWWIFHEDRFANWYVNLEEPSVRWDDGDVCGVDFSDQDLDIVVEPDRSWSWKDEDEFTERLALPEHYWVADEAAVRAEGARVIPIIEAGSFPFDGSWCAFRPDPLWTMPAALPPGWNRPRARPAG
jgi:hypothetical protein